jgi:Predicted hydrolases or acyltransferases (alpha/beta hydrolase superfamily)
MTRARINGIEMAYDDAGKGQPVLLLHGFPFNRTMWRAQVEALQGAYRFITPDLRGHGETEIAETATMDEMAEDAAALLDELKIERAVVGGLSMGGYVTLAFYQKFPERVRALILADTRPQDDTDEAKKAREQQALKALQEGMTPIADGLLPKLIAEETFEELPEVAARLREMMHGMDARGTAAALRGMAQRKDRTALLRKIDVPTLIIVGSRDAITPPEVSHEMQSEIRGSRLEIMEGAGHVSNLERPAEFNRALQEFLDGLQN